MSDDDAMFTRKSGNKHMQQRFVAPPQYYEHELEAQSCRRNGLHFVGAQGDVVVARDFGSRGRCGCQRRTSRREERPCHIAGQTLKQAGGRRSM
ncbi:hypothetical protein GUJ93_ZPchr0008g12702 [Zizania palustris]|uniref:Uncharacterized protein n=1 Tax=Zizania palustris TaxID=103762 RepID=A0A8J5R394_ZIZPA|nr:hypothetical protein GUJ93_ZPchr0008g12702 [Zizania palustris]